MKKNYVLFTLMFISVLLLMLPNKLLAQKYVYSFISAYNDWLYATPVSGGSQEWIELNPDSNGATYIPSADDNYLYASAYSNNKAFRYDLLGQNGSELFTVSTTDNFGTANNDLYVFVATNTSMKVHRADKADGGNVTTYDFSGYTAYIALNSTYLFAGGGNNNTSSIIYRCDIDGNNKVEFLTAQAPVIGIAANESYIYWRTSGGWVGRASVNGTNINHEFISVAAQLYRGIAVDENFIYVINISGQMGIYNLDGTINTQLNNGIYQDGFCIVTRFGSSTWIGTTSTDWNTATNWSTGIVPTSTDNVTIPDVTNDPVIVSGVGASCNALTVAAGASLTVNSGGSLITNGSITNNGTIDVKRIVSYGTWHLIGMPNAVTTSNTFVGDYLQTWNENTATWSDITPTTTALLPAKGYSLWWPLKAPEKTYTFSGTPNTGNQSIAITANGTSGNYNGANLLGNPYPSSIDWSNLDDTYGAVYYWNGAMYVSWNNGSGTGSATQYIPPMQGFFIVAGSSGTFSVSDQNRTHTGATTFHKTADELTGGIVLFADNGSYHDELILLQRDNCNAGFELQTDALKFMSNTPGISQLWSVCPDGNLSIDARPYQETIPLGFANDVAGIYTIGISEIADITSALLEDTKANLFHDLTKGAYEFAWDVNDDENRFKLHLNVVGMEETPGSESNILIYATNGNIFIKGAANGDMRISDLMGRIVLQQQIHGTDVISIQANLKTGIYLVMIQQGRDVKTEKIFIR